MGSGHKYATVLVTETHKFGIRLGPDGIPDDYSKPYLDHNMKEWKSFEDYILTMHFDAVADGSVWVEPGTTITDVSGHN